MSPDLPKALKAAVQAPHADLDVTDIARRAKRVGRFRYGGFALLSLLLIGLSSAVVARMGTSPSLPPGEDPGRGRRFEVPGGPRYEVASGTYGADWDENYAGTQWRLLVWGNDEEHCSQLAEEDSKRMEGVSCSRPNRDASDDDEFIGGLLYFETGSPDPDEFLFMTGDVEAPVAALQFRADGGKVVEIPLIDPPPAAGVDRRYFVATLPRYNYGELVAWDEENDVLQTRTLCGPGCQADNETEDAERIAAYEARETSLMSRAAVVANAALANAGMYDAFKISYNYRNIVQDVDGFVASFQVSRCVTPSRKNGVYTCRERLGKAWLRVKAGDERVEVVDTGGLVTRRQRAELVGYGEGIPQDAPRWRHLGTKVGPVYGGRNWPFELVMIWTGDLPGPAPGYGSVCGYVTRDTSGDVLRKDALPYEVRTDRSEYFRVSEMTTEITSKTRPVETEVSCDDPAADIHGRG